MVAEHITNLPCDKHSGKRVHTQMLVVHSIESPLANGYAVSMANNWLGKWYQADGSLIEASSNVIVSPDTLVRSVHTDYAAWHASWANSLSIGYEQAGYAAFTRAQWLTELGKTQIDRLAREMALDAETYGIPLVWLTRAQVNAISAGNRTIKGLVTHAVIDPANRTDPGSSSYPYDVLLASIRKYAGGTTGQSGTITPIDTAPIPEEGFLMALTEQQQKDIYWILCTNSGREYLAELVGGRAASKTLNTPIKSGGRGAELVAETSLASSVRWKDDHTLQLLDAIAAIANRDGATVAEIQAALKDTLAESVVKVEVSVTGNPEAGTK